MQGYLPDGRWSSLVSRLGEIADLEATCRSFGALQRVRNVRSADHLLRIALTYGPGQLSLRTTAAALSASEIMSISDKGVLGRLCKMGDWLDHLLGRLLQQKHGLDYDADALNLTLVDGSVVCSPGNGGDWRLHASFDAKSGCFGDLTLTSSKVAERVDRTRIAPGQTLVQDRGYARVANFTAALTAGADFITRIGWNSLQIFDSARQRLSVLDGLPEDETPVERLVHVKGVARPLRLVIQRLPPEQVERQRQRVARKSAKSGYKIDPRTEQAAGYLMLMTSLPADRQTAEQVAALYRNRWQIELGFKRLKTLGGLDKLPALKPELARTWLLAQLIIAVLTDEIASEIVGFPP